MELTINVNIHKHKYYERIDVKSQKLGNARLQNRKQENRHEILCHAKKSESPLLRLLLQLTIPQ